MVVILGQGNWGKRLKAECEQVFEVKTWTHTQEPFEIAENDIVIIAIPSPYLIETLEKFTKVHSHILVCSATKGITITGEFPSTVIKSYWNPKDIVILGGASISSEDKLEIIASFVQSGAYFHRWLEFIKLANFFVSRGSLFTADNHWKELEITNVLKNVYAIGFNIKRTLHGDNLAAAWLVGAWEELRSMVCETYLSDLIATCMSEKSRNCRAGKLIAEHRKIDFGHQVAEGIHTAQMIKKYDLFRDMPMLRSIVDLITMEVK